MRMVARSKSIAPIAHARGRSREIQTPLSTSEFFRRARTLHANLVSFYPVSNCMECLLKKAVNVTDIQKSTNEEILLAWPSSQGAGFECRCFG